MSLSVLSPEYASRKAKRTNSDNPDLWTLLDQVCDPELPGVTIWDLGILQNVRETPEDIEVEITPTYSGCPAVDTIREDIKAALLGAGNEKVKVRVVLSPAWSTDMMSPQGKAQLKAIQIAPPNQQNKVYCPKCDSKDTTLVSQFGSTACKALYQCSACLEHFDYFKHF